MISGFCFLFIEVIQASWLMPGVAPKQGFLGGEGESQMEASLFLKGDVWYPVDVLDTSKL